MPTLRLSAPSPALSTGHLPEHHLLGLSPLVLSYDCLREEALSFTGSSFDDVPTLAYERLVCAVRVVNTLNIFARRSFKEKEGKTFSKGQRP